MVMVCCKYLKLSVRRDDFNLNILQKSFPYYVRQICFLVSVYLFIFTDLNSSSIALHQRRL